MDSSTALLLALVAVLAFGPAEGIVGGGAAPPPPVDDPVAFVIKDDREARVYGTRDRKSGYYMFRGIRYAEPPVGNRRFLRSVPLYLEGDVNATRWAAPCPQPGENGGVIGSEDCLFLNVFTPVLPDATDGYPVLIWIHGGGFRRGAATQYGMRHLIQKNTIVVSIQYRLGSLGFLSDGTKDLPGNNGLFDMILATEWVRDYIEFFGGNPKRIVAFGQGTGASSAFLLGISKFGNEYFSGIIAMSGSILSRFAVDKEPRNSSRAMAASTNCPVADTVEMVRCLRGVPFGNLVEQDTREESFSRQVKNFISDLSALLGPGPVVEGRNDLRSLPNFVTDEPENSLSLDDFPDIPLLTGVVKDETGGAIYGPFKDTVTQVLSSVPDFLTKNLVPSLQKIVPIIGDTAQQFVPEAFGKYLSLPFGNGRSKREEKVDGIAKVTEALNDAIFNVPAFLTVKNWSKKSKAFLYSFDHNSKAGYGKAFLDGLPIVGNSAETGKTSHGDDLGYLFEPNSIHGNPLPTSQNTNEEDDMVKDVFTDLIANFARTGNISGNAKSSDGSSLFSLPSFSGSDDDGYLSITSQPKVEKGFRFCEMGLWTGIAERLKTAACSAFLVDLKEPLKTVQKTVSNTISKVPTLPQVGSVSEFLNPDTLAKPSLPGELPGISKIIPNPLSNGKNGNLGESIIPKVPVPTPKIPLPNPLSNQDTQGIPKISNPIQKPKITAPSPKIPFNPFG